MTRSIHPASGESALPARLARFLSGFLFLAATGFAGVADDGEPVFALHLADGTTPVGLLREIGGDWSIRLDGIKSFHAAGMDVISLRRQGMQLPPRPVGEQVVLSNGDRVPLLVGAVVRLTGERLDATPQSPLKVVTGSELKLPLAAVALLWIAAPDGTDEPALLLRRLLAARRSKDVVLLRNGDRVEGTVTALDRGTSCRLEVNKKPLEVPFARVAAIAFNTDLLARPRPKGPFGYLVLSNGGRLALASAQVDVKRGVLLAKTILGTAVHVPILHVAALDLLQGRASYLSDLEPRSYQHTPFLGVSWPLVKDGSAAGGDLRLGGNNYDKGLGLHSQARLTYDLAAQYDWFEALVGLDDQAGRRGRARIQVLVDGKTQDLGRDKEMTARDEPLAMRIDVRKARVLTLAVEFGSLGDTEAHVDWADARLIKSSPR
jgi:hypothetical protein